MSSAVDEDVVRTVESGRQTLGAMLSEAQSHLQVVFIVFVVGLIGTIWALRAYVWEQMKEDLLAQAPAAEIISVTPFDVILLQVKIGLFIGVALSIPLLVYYSRDALRVRGWWPAQHVSRWKLVALTAASGLLFLGGMAYAYAVFFPLLFDFLTASAVSAGLVPHYSIVKWFQFVAILTLAFGFSAQLPLLMSTLTYTGIVSYQMFHDYWKHAILAIVVIASVVNGSPDPFSMGLVAAPMIVLYVVGLGLSKLISVTLVNPDTNAGSTPASAGDPQALDVSELDAQSVRAAPIEAFAAMTEERALSLASEAMEADEPKRAQAILDRFDEAQELRDADPVENGATAAAANHVDEDGEIEDAANATESESASGDETEDRNETEDGSVFTRTGAGMLDAFTEEDVDEDDIGGYYYDVAFIFKSLTSRAFRIVGVFLTVLTILFAFLYRGGIGIIKEDFLRRLPAGVTPDAVNIVTLHPLEAIIFAIKVATVIAFVATLPLILYYAWPALKERGFAQGDRNVLVVWGGSLFAALAIGSVFGYAVVAPTIISWLAADVIAANMVIAYQISSFGWLVFFTTVGVGILATIPVSMVLFHVGGLVPYRSMRRHWRVITLAVFTIIAVFSPRGVFMMFLLGVPVMLAYALGLAILHAVTLGGRRGGGAERVEAAD